MKSMTKKAKIAALALVTGVSFSFAAVPAVHAFSIGSVIGTIAGGVLVYKQLDKHMDTINETEEGRQQYFAQMKEDMGVSQDAYYNAMLDQIMSNLSEGITATNPDLKPTLQEKPFLYFLNEDTTFNAACGLGRVMTVNKGLFSMSDNVDEVAFVLAHEMGHGIKDHALNGTKKKVKTAIGGSVAAEALGGSTLSSLGMGIVVAQINNVQIGKKAEWEADNLAFDYCYSAGYNPGAGAALWQRVLEKYGESKHNFVGEIFSPSDHPSHEQRRDNYEKKLTKLSKDKVTIKKGTDMVQVNGKDFVAPAATSSMSSAERKYFLMGNLAAAYDQGKNVSAATVKNGTLYLGDQAIITPTKDDPSVEELAKKLNAIK